MASPDNIATFGVAWFYGPFRLRWVAYIPILPYNQAAAEWHARERARLTRIGQSPPFVDGQIAAIANAHGVIVVTRNEGDFQRFDEITVENWFLPDSQNGEMETEL